MFIPLDAPLGGLRIASLTSLAMGGRWRTEAMRSYTRPVLYNFTRDQGRFVMAGQTYGYSAHTLAIVPTGVMHGFEVNARVHGHAVFFPREQQYKSLETQTLVKVSGMNQQAELTGLIDQLSNEMQNKKTEFEVAALALVELITVAVDRIRNMDTKTERPNAAKRLAAAYTALLEGGFSTGASVANFAKELDVTPTHLSRACRETCGKPASALLLDRLFFEARKLLMETKLPIKEIAKMLGFRSAAYFSRAFSQRIGVSPSEFRLYPV